MFVCLKHHMGPKLPRWIDSSAVTSSLSFPPVPVCPFLGNVIHRFFILNLHMYPWICIVIT